MSVEHKRKDFTSYEYKEIIADRKNVSFWIEGYEKFGWKQELENIEREHLGYQGKRIIRLRRSRKIINKMELTRLQNNFEACARDLEKLEQAKTSIASVYALTVGFLGIVFMAGCIWAVTAPVAQRLVCVVLAILGVMGILSSYFVYRRVEAKQTKRLASLMEEKYEEIREVCEKGKRLLHFEN